MAPAGAPRQRRFRRPRPARPLRPRRRHGRRRRMPRLRPGPAQGRPPTGRRRLEIRSTPLGAGPIREAGFGSWAARYQRGDKAPSQGLHPAGSRHDWAIKRGSFGNAFQGVCWPPACLPARRRARRRKSCRSIRRPRGSACRESAWQADLSPSGRKVVLPDGGPGHRRRSPRSSTSTRRRSAQFSARAVSRSRSTGVSSRPKRS